MQLLSILPIEIAEIIMRESEDTAEDYAHVKELLLNRYKLDPETFRQKFNQHQRKQGTLWRDLIFELRSYLDGWLEGVQVKDFNSLKDLLIAEQIKKKGRLKLRIILSILGAPLSIPLNLRKKWMNTSPRDDLFVNLYLDGVSVKNPNRLLNRVKKRAEK